MNNPKSSAVEPIAITGVINADMWADESAREPITDMFRQRLIAMAEQDYFMRIDPRATRMTVAEIDNTFFTHRFRMMWWPNDADPIELWGGPNDGKVMHIHGPGAPSWNVIVEMPPTLVSTDTAPTIDSSMRAARYDRKGINEATQRWVYEFGGPV